MSDRPRVVVDCDPGIDDAFALWTALRHCEVLGVTSVAGNVGLDHTTANARRVLDSAAADEVPVHAGAESAIEGQTYDAAHVHGDDGLAGSGLPGPSKGPDGRDATAFLTRTLSAFDGVYIVAMGPLTNIAILLRDNPETADRIAGLYLMGGSLSGGNATPHAEFNIWADPAAAELVFAAPVRRTMVGLDLTHTVRFGRRELDRLGGATTPTAKAGAGLLDAYLAFHRTIEYDPGIRHVVQQIEQRSIRPAPVHDPCAVLALTHPSLFEMTTMSIGVETSEAERLGRTFRDDHGHNSTKVAERADVEALVDLIIEATIAPIADL